VARYAAAGAVNSAVAVNSAMAVNSGSGGQRMAVDKGNSDSDSDSDSDRRGVV
jgi:hypothetical protein